MLLKKSLYLCAAALMLMGAGSTSVSASSSSHSNHSAHIARHLSNVKRIANVKATHAKNLHRINRIKKHLINHQKNLIKISRKLNRAKRHHRNSQLISQLNHDKAQLIKAVENNERGMVRLAETVAREEHQINLMRHPKAQAASSKATNQTPTKPVVNPQPSTQVTLPSVSGSTQDYSVAKSVSTFISEVNGKLTKYVAKDSNSWNRNGQSGSNAYSDVNGQYSASPAQITRDEINQLNQQVQNQIQNSNNWMKDFNQELNQEFSWF